MLTNQLVETNNTVTELSESLGVRSYVVMPCIVCMCLPRAGVLSQQH